MLWLVVLMLAVSTFTASPAGAHTALVSSSPETGSSLATGPETISLLFAEAVDPAAVRVELARADGLTTPQPVLATAGSGAVELVEFTVGSLDEGVYGLAWETVGPDGHRVFGEVILGVGQESSVGLTDLRITDQGGASDVVDRLLGLTRFGFWVAFMVLVGTLVFGRCGIASPIRPERAASALGLAWVLRGVIVVWSVVSVRSGSLVTRLADVITSRTGAALVLGVVGALVVSRAVRAPGPATMVRAGGFGAALVALAAVMNGHTVLLSGRPFEAWLSAAHVLAAGMWVGPVLLLAVLAVRDRGIDADAMVGLRRQGRLAAASVVVLALTGVRSLTVTTAGDVTGSAYGTLLAWKLSIVGVAAALGLVHGVGVWRRARLPRRAPLLLEAAAMVAAVVAVTMIADATPSSIERSPVGSESPLTQVLEAAEVRDVDACGSLEVGRVSCYNEHLVQLLEDDGADRALAEVARLVAVDSAFASDCHQFAHDLGNAASAVYEHIGDALAFDGTVCGSGYYHGLLEQAIGDLAGPDQLRDEVVSICPGARDDAPSVVTFQCVHGIGHGMMLNLDDVHAGALVCSAFERSWAQASCVGGVHMENIMAFYNTEFVFADQRTVETTPDFSDTDPYYPCNTIAAPLQVACFEQHASYLLLSVGNEPTAAGELCAGSSTDTAVVASCFAGLGRHLLGDVAFDGPAGVERCEAATTDYLFDCVVGAMRTALNHTGDDSLAPAVCAAAPDEVRERCNEEFASRLGAYESAPA